MHRPLFATCRDVNACWVPVIEKAYAKLCGSYRNIIRGLESEGLVDLGGGIAMTLLFHEKGKDISKDELWNLVSNYYSRGDLLGTATNNDNGRNGIIPNHAYGVLSVNSIPQCQKLVKV